MKLWLCVPTNWASDESYVVRAETPARALELAKLYVPQFADEHWEEPFNLIAEGNEGVISEGSQPVDPPTGDIQK